MNAPIPTHVLPTFEPRPVPAAMLAALKQRFGDRCSTALAVREQHGRDESPVRGATARGGGVLREHRGRGRGRALAAEHAVPVIPFGVGSSLEGHLLAVQGGVSIDSRAHDAASCASTPKT